jgi:hypothetical protein
MAGRKWKRIAFGLAVSLSVCYAPWSNILMAEDLGIEDIEEALARAVGVLGLKDSDLSRIEDDTLHTVSLITASDSTNEYALAYINGRTSWSVLIQQVPIASAVVGQQINEGSRQKNFLVLLDKDSGGILKVRFCDVDSDIVSYPDRFSDYYEMTRLQREDLQGGQSELPRISVLEALGKCKFYPGLASGGTCYYLLYSRNKSAPRPAWLIYLYDMGELPTPSGSLYDNMRIVIDAETGEFLHGPLSVSHPPNDSTGVRE